MCGPPLRSEVWNSQAAELRSCFYRSTTCMACTGGPNPETHSSQSGGTCLFRPSGKKSPTPKGSHLFDSRQSLQAWAWMSSPSQGQILAKPGSLRGYFLRAADVKDLPVALRLLGLDRGSSFGDLPFRSASASQNVAQTTSGDAGIRRGGVFLRFIQKSKKNLLVARASGCLCLLGCHWSEGP